MKLVRLSLSICLALLFTGCGGKKPKPGPANQDTGWFEPENVRLETDNDMKKLVGNKLVYTDATNKQWTAVAGTRTDGASVPRFALSLTNGREDDKFLKAAIIHDAYCQDVNEHHCPRQYREESWQDVHRMFHQACIDCGSSPSLARIM